VSLSRSPQAAARRCGAGDAAPPRRWVPFAEGPRSCVGQALAQVTLPATLALLLGRFRFCLAPQARAAARARARARCMGALAAMAAMHAAAAAVLLLPTAFVSAAGEERLLNMRASARGNGPPARESMVDGVHGTNADLTILLYCFLRESCESR